MVNNKNNKKITITSMHTYIDLSISGVLDILTLLILVTTQLNKQ